MSRGNIVAIHADRLGAPPAMAGKLIEERFGCRFALVTALPLPGACLAGVVIRFGGWAAIIWQETQRMPTSAGGRTIGFGEPARLVFEGPDAGGLRI